MPPSLRDRFRRRSPPTTAASATAASASSNSILGGSLGRRSNHSDNGSSSHSSSSNSHSLYGPHTNTGGLSGGGGGRMRGLRRSGRRNNPQQPQRPPLAAFDACVEACDALAASAAPRHHERREEAPTGEGAAGSKNEEGNDGEEATSNASTNDKKGRESAETIPDCSVLVSPDGALLFTSSQSTNVLHLKDAHGNNNTEGSNGEGSDNNNSNSPRSSSRYPWTNIPAAHRDTTLLREDYASAIICFPWFKQFYIERVPEYFDGDQSFGRADDFVDALLRTPPSLVETSDGRTVGLTDPLRIAERIIALRSEIAGEWKAMMGEVPQDHAQLNDVLFRVMVGRTIDESGN